MKFGNILDHTEKFYTGTFEKHGTKAKGVDWKNDEAQEISFEQILKLVDTTNDFSINDFGCGYGAFFKYLTEKNLKFTYAGCDLSSKMIVSAKESYKNHTNCKFHVDSSDLTPADYTVACAIFFIKWDYSNEKWKEYIIDTIDQLKSLSKKGFAFNMLTKYSDKHLMRDDLYYADPCWIFDYCKTKFSRNVALLHDYEKYEFTIIVRL